MNIQAMLINPGTRAKDTCIERDYDQIHKIRISVIDVLHAVQDSRSIILISEFHVPSKVIIYSIYSQNGHKRKYRNINFNKYFTFKVN